MSWPGPAAFRGSVFKPQAADPENHWFARRNRQRLDAEQIRDTVLLAANRLDLTMGGPGDRQLTRRPGVHVTPGVADAAFDRQARVAQPVSGAVQQRRVRLRELTILKPSEAKKASQ